VTIWIYTDADNTLWDTDGVYANAQLSLLSAAEQITGLKGPTDDRLVFVRQYDQAIASRHHAHLRYPPSLLLRALTQGLSGISPDLVATQATSHGHQSSQPETLALSTFRANLSRTPSLLPGVVEGLSLAKESKFPIYVVTEGPADLLRSRLSLLCLDQFITESISATKTRELYTRLMKRASPHHAAMIGDQVDRDVRLAKESGMRTALVPSRFRPNWTKTSDLASADLIAENFAEAIRWVITTAIA
jgi:putative hydrolase of the HAD superfamily